METMNKKSQRVAILLAILAAALYAISTPVSKVMLQVVPPTMVAAFLYLGAGIGVGTMMLVRHERKRPSTEERLHRRDIPYTAAMVTLDDGDCHHQRLRLGPWCARHRPCHRRIPARLAASRRHPPAGLCCLWPEHLLLHLCPAHHRSRPHQHLLCPRSLHRSIALHPAAWRTRHTDVHDSFAHHGCRVLDCRQVKDNLHERCCNFGLYSNPGKERDSEQIVQKFTRNSCQILA